VRRQAEASGDRSLPPKSAAEELGLAAEQPPRGGSRRSPAQHARRTAVTSPSLLELLAMDLLQRGRHSSSAGAHGGG
jgi:hypothetical protein